MSLVPSFSPDEYANRVQHVQPLRDQIETVADLVRWVSDAKTGGYIADFEIQPNQERARVDGGFFLIIDVRHTEPGDEYNIDGEWWFDADSKVVQVL